METQTVVLASYVACASVGLAAIVILVNKMVAADREAKAPAARKASPSR